MLNDISAFFLPFAAALFNGTLIWTCFFLHRDATCFFVILCKPGSNRYPHSADAACLIAT